MESTAKKQTKICLFLGALWDRMTEERKNIRFSPCFLKKYGKKRKIPVCYREKKRDEIMKNFKKMLGGAMKEKAGFLLRPWPADGDDCQRKGKNPRMGSSKLSIRGMLTGIVFHYAG